MELLLFLSALLTALTGAMSGARAPEVGMHQSVEAFASKRAPCSHHAIRAPRLRAYLSLADGWLSPFASIALSIENRTAPLVPRTVTQASAPAPATAT